MKMRKLFIAAVLMAASTPIFAQSDIEETVEYSTDKYKVETNSFWSNWFIQAGAGASVYFGDADSELKFGKRISPSVDVAIGKWFTPGIGVRAAYNGVAYKGATKNGAFSTGELLENSSLYKQKMNYFNIHADVMFNLSNIFCGYNEKRVWNISPYVGMGALHAYKHGKSTEMSANFGLYNSFRLCKALDLFLDLRGVVTSDGFDNEIAGCRGEGSFSASLGLTYKLKKRDWDRSKTVTRVDNGAINALRAQVNDMNAENERLQKELEEANARKVAPVKKVVTSNLIVFPIGKSELSSEGRANLSMMAEQIKEGDASTVYTVTGYADAGTGSKKVNERLSKERAEAVYKCLVEDYGVSESQLKLDYKGGVDNMFFDDPRLSRAVITRVQ